MEAFIIVKVETIKQALTDPIRVLAFIAGPFGSEQEANESIEKNQSSGTYFVLPASQYKMSITDSEGKLKIRPLRGG